jgi:hypothetical protein
VKYLTRIGDSTQFCEDLTISRRRGCVMAAKSGGGSNSVRERRKVRESSRARGSGARCSGARLAFYRGRRRVGEVATGGNWQRLMALRPLMAGQG